MTGAKVIVASPVSYKVADGQPFFTGREWLQSILAQDYPGLSVYVLANDLLPEMESSLVSVTNNRCHIESLTLGNSPDQRGSRKKADKVYERFATIRNMVLDYVLSTDADYYISIDSDVIVHPDAVSRLVRQMSDRPEYGMIGAIVNNTRGSNIKRKFPRAIYNFGRLLDKVPKGSQIRMKPLCRFKRGEFFDVDYTGACMIINMKMLREHPGVRWGPHKQGEDLYMCERIQETSYKMGVDTSIVTLHKMDHSVGTEDEGVFNSGDFI